MTKGVCRSSDSAPMMLAGPLGLGSRGAGTPAILSQGHFVTRFICCLNYSGKQWNGLVNGQIVCVSGHQSVVVVAFRCWLLFVRFSSTLLAAHVSRPPSVIKSGRIRSGQHPPSCQHAPLAGQSISSAPAAAALNPTSSGRRTLPVRSNPAAGLM